MKPTSDAPDLDAIVREACEEVERHGLGLRDHPVPGGTIPVLEERGRAAIRAALEQAREQDRAILAEIHEAIGEHPESDDESLPEVIAQIRREMAQRIEEQEVEIKTYKALHAYCEQHHDCDAAEGETPCGKCGRKRRSVKPRPCIGGWSHKHPVCASCWRRLQKYRERGAR